MRAKTFKLLRTKGELRLRLYSGPAGILVYRYSHGKLLFSFRSRNHGFVSTFWPPRCFELSDSALKLHAGLITRSQVDSPFDIAYAEFLAAADCPNDVAGLLSALRIDACWKYLLLRRFAQLEWSSFYFRLLAEKPVLGLMFGLSRLQGTPYRWMKKYAAKSKTQDEFFETVVSIVARGSSKATVIALSKIHVDLSSDFFDLNLLVGFFKTLRPGISKVKDPHEKTVMAWLKRRCFISTNMLKWLPLFSMLEDFVSEQFLDESYNKIALGDCQHQNLMIFLEFCQIGIATRLNEISELEAAVEQLLSVELPPLCFAMPRRAALSGGVIKTAGELLKTAARMKNCAFDLLPELFDGSYWLIHFKYRIKRKDHNYMLSIRALPGTDIMYGEELKGTANREAEPEVYSLVVDILLANKMGTGQLKNG